MITTRTTSSTRKRNNPILYTGIILGQGSSGCYFFSWLYGNGVKIITVTVPFFQSHIKHIIARRQIVEITTWKKIYIIDAIFQIVTIVIYQVYTYRSIIGIKTSFVCGIYSVLCLFLQSNGNWVGNGSTVISIQGNVLISTLLPYLDIKYDTGLKFRGWNIVNIAIKWSSYPIFIYITPYCIIIRSRSSYSFYLYVSFLTTYILRNNCRSAHGRTGRNGNILGIGTTIICSGNNSIVSNIY